MDALARPKWSAASDAAVLEGSTEAAQVQFTRQVHEQVQPCVLEELYLVLVSLRSERLGRTAAMRTVLLAEL
jgi:hypothetical protein